MKVVRSGTFQKWMKKLKDARAQGLIAARLFRLSEGHPGDVSPVGDGVSELRIHHGPGYRIYFHVHGNTIIILLCGGDKASQSRDIQSAKQLLKEWKTTMAETFSEFDPAEYLATDEAIASFMADAFETRDSSHIAKALGVVARAKGMSQIANETGLSREQLYRSFSETGNPTLKTTLAVMKALGLDLTAKVRA